MKLLDLINNVIPIPVRLLYIFIYSRTALDLRGTYTIYIKYKLHEH